MRPQQIMFMGFVLAVGTFISLTFAGLWIGSEEVEVANAVTAFKQANILGIWSVMVPNVSFFLIGVKSLMMLDFAFFQDETEIIQWFLFMTIGLGFTWGIYTIVISSIQGLFRRP